MKTYSCPQCAASMSVDPAAGVTQRCPYCGSRIATPEELRWLPEDELEEEPEDEPEEPTAGSRPYWKYLLGLLLLVVAAAIAFPIALRRFVLPRPGTPSADLPRPSPAPRQGIQRPVPLDDSPAPKPAGTPGPGYRVPVTFGREGAGPGLFKGDMDLTVDAQGRIFVSDETMRVQRFDSKGTFAGLWMIPTKTASDRKVRGAPDRLLADRKGRIYVVVGGYVLTFGAETGELVHTVNGSGYAVDAALRPDGGLLLVWADEKVDTLIQLNAKLEVAKRIPRFLTEPVDTGLEVMAYRLAVDGAGNVFVLYAIGDLYGEHWYNSADLAVYRFTRDGRYVNKFGSGGSETGQFLMPSGIAVDSQGQVFVSDGFHDKKIKVFAADGRYLRSMEAPHPIKSMTFGPDDALYIAGSSTVSKLLLTKSGES